MGGIRLKNQLLEVQNARRTFQGFTPKIALNYKFHPNWSLYSSYVWSFRSPAGNELENPPFPISSRPGELINPDLKPQLSKNLEAGIKGMLIRPQQKFFPKIIFESSLFRYDIEQEIVPFEIGGEYYFQNSARTLRNGVEVGSAIDLLKNLYLNLAYTYSHFKYDQYAASRYYYDGQPNLVLEEQDFSGNIVPSVPRHHYSLALRYEKYLFSGFLGFTRIGTWGVSEMYTDDANSENTEAFQIFDFSLGFDAKVGLFNLIFSTGIQNIFDKRYVGFININSASQQYYEAGAPFNFFTTLKFGLQF